MKNSVEKENINNQQIQMVNLLNNQTQQNHKHQITQNVFISFIF
jgi:hypothetical protein